MKKTQFIIACSLIMASGSALAMGFTAEQGKNFTNLNMEIGKSSSGPVSYTHLTLPTN